MTKDKITKVFFLFVGGLAILNLFILDFFLLTKKEEEKALPGGIEIIKPESQATVAADICGPACQEEIGRAISTLVAQPKKPSTPTSAPSPAEIYISVGAGSTTSLDWTDVPAAEVYIDTTKYGKIREAYFEAQLRVPMANGSVCARIFNQTDKAFVFSSEVCSTSQKGERVTSPKISLYSGNKLYRIQMKVTMPYEGILDLGRIKLVWE